MALMSIGYIILAGIMGVKWGVLYRTTGNIWVGLGDHLFNNTVATNMLHVVSGAGADELQIVRIAGSLCRGQPGQHGKYVHASL